MLGCLVGPSSFFIFINSFHRVIHTCRSLILLTTCTNTSHEIQRCLLLCKNRIVVFPTYNWSWLICISIKLLILQNNTSIILRWLGCILNAHLILMGRLLCLRPQIFYLLLGIINTKRMKWVQCLVTSWCISSIDRLVMPVFHFLKILCCRLVRRTCEVIFFILVSLITFFSHIALGSRWVSIILIWIIRIWPWISLCNKIVYDVFESLSAINFPFTHGHLHSLRLFEFIQIWLWIIWVLSRMLLFHFIFKFYFCFHLWLWIRRGFRSVVGNIITHFSVRNWTILALSNFVFG